MLRDVRIRTAEEADWPAISQLLNSCGLPSDDVDVSSRLFYLAVLDENVVGCACAERYEETVVVRSVGVLQEYRDHQIATHLVGAVLTRACADGCKKAVLVTTDYLGSFARDDFSPASLDSMPEEVELSRKFLRRFAATAH